MTYQQAQSCQIPTLSEIYEKEFGDIKGTFVDVGSHDGYYCSNIWGLAIAGWGGLCFEPIVELYNECSRRYVMYPIRVFNTAVGGYDGEVTIFTDGNPTINFETAQKSPWGFKYNLQHSKRVPCITLNTALAANHIPENFEVLSVDVEGAELEVLDGIDFNIWKPHMVIMETGKDHHIQSYRIHAKAIEQRMLEAGFKEIYFDEINSIYTR